MSLTGTFVSPLTYHALMLHFLCISNSPVAFQIPCRLGFSIDLRSIYRTLRRLHFIEATPFDLLPGVISRALYPFRRAAAVALHE